MSEWFEIKNVWVSALLCAISIVLFYLFNWLIKKLFKKNTNKGLTVLNIFLNVFLIIAFIIAVLFSLGLKINKVIEYFSKANPEQVLQENILRIIGIILVIVISSIVLATVSAILKSTKLKNPKDQKRKRTLDKVIMSLTRYIVIIIDAVAILMLLGVNVIPALAGLGIAGLVLGLGAQKLITDFISGLFIIIEHHFDVGDIVDIGGFKGEVIDLGLKTTKIRNWQGQVKIIANSELVSIVNCSLNDTVFSTSFNISYQADIDKAIKLINEELPKRLKGREEIIQMPVCNGASALSTISITLNVVATAKTESQYQLTRDINVLIKQILTENNIEFPSV